MTDRAQATLLGFAAAAVIVVTVAVAGVALADDALVDADREPAATRAVDRLAAHLVAADAAHTREPNVLRADRTVNLTLADLERAVPSIRGREVSVSLGEEVLLSRGDVATGSGRRPAGSARTERLVRVERDTPRTERIDLAARDRTRLPDHTGRIVVRVAANRTVHTVRADGRVVLHDPAGLSGTYVVAVPDVRPLPVVVGSDGGGRGTVEVSWTATTARTERLVVIVGA